MSMALYELPFIIFNIIIIIVVVVIIIIIIIITTTIIIIITIITDRYSIEAGMLTVLKYVIPAHEMH